MNALQKVMSAKTVAKAIFYFLIAIPVTYATICLFMFTVSITFLGVGQPISIEPFKSFQRYWYFEGARNNWAFVDGCSKPDPELLYTANEGTCTFYNTEFHTAITQTELGRKTPAVLKNMNSSSLVVLGDSMAFGWGVEDDETFSNHLKTLLQKKVFNFGVPSYATERELKLFERNFKLLEKIDTVIIQYAPSDFTENALFTRPEALEKKRKRFEQKFYASKNQTPKVYTLHVFRDLKISLTMPINLIRDTLKADATDFTDHHEHLVKILKPTLEKHKEINFVLTYLSRFNAVNFSNFPVGKSDSFENLYYFEPSLNDQLFFIIDDHLNAAGHKEFSRQMSLFLSKNNL